MRFKRFPDGDPAIRRSWLDLRHQRWFEKLLNWSWIIPAIVIIAMASVFFIGVGSVAVLIITTFCLLLILGFYFTLAFLLPAGESRRTGLAFIAIMIALVAITDLVIQYLLPMLI